MREEIDAQGLLLRPWTDRDAEAVVTAHDEPLRRLRAPEPIDTVEAALRWIRLRDERREEGSAFSFAVVDAADTVLGDVTLSEIERRHSTGWISYWTTAAARRRGVATRACRAVSRWAFDEVGLFRLELGHTIDNSASCRVATAAGFAVEGRERARLLYGGIRHDVERHARLVTDPEPRA